MATKPRISFIAQALLPVELSNNSLVLKKNGTNYSDKTELTDFIDGLYEHPDSDTYLYCKCQCGEEYSYVDKTSVPDSNTNCTACSRKIIEYL